MKVTQIKQPMQSWWETSSLHPWSLYGYYFKYNINIYKYININNVFQQHAFINMRIVASICVNITPNTSRNFIYSALPAKKKILCMCCCCQENSLILIVLGFNHMSTLVGHFVSSPREREKRDRRDSRRDEREDREERRKRNKSESEETEEIKTFPFYPYLLQG